MLPSVDLKPRSVKPSSNLIPDFLEAVIENEFSATSCCSRLQDGLLVLSYLLTELSMLLLVGLAPAAGH